MQIRVSARKLEKPGVSIRLSFTPFHSEKATAALRLIPRLISSSSKSVVVFPSSMRPSRFIAPVSKRIASVKEVFPSCEWPTIPTFRICVISYSFMGTPSSSA